MGKWGMGKWGGGGDGLQCDEWTVPPFNLTVVSVEFFFSLHNVSHVTGLTTRTPTLGFVHLRSQLACDCQLFSGGVMQCVRISLADRSRAFLERL